MALGDLNHDGRLDIVVANQAVESVSVFLNSGGGNFARKIDYGVDAPYDLALGDVNGDGRLDVVTASQTSVGVLLGGEMARWPPRRPTTSGPPMRWPWAT